MFQLKIPATKAKFGPGMFDSELDTSKVGIGWNARLSLKLKVKMVFATVHTLLPGKIVRLHNKTYAKDADGKLFRMVDWDANEVDLMRKMFQVHAENFWSYRFCLTHQRRDYSGLDSPTPNLESAIRPAVECVLDITLLDQNDHGESRKIHVFKLDPAATSYIDRKGKTQTIGARSSFTWRSDAKDYDNLDWDGGTDQANKSDYDAADWNATTTGQPSLFSHVDGSYVEYFHDTIAHEIGHALNQQHIMSLKYNKNKVKAGSSGNGTNDYKGKLLIDSLNVMGSGNLVSVENGISWVERLAQHTDTHSSDWVTNLGFVAPRMLNQMEMIGL
jgi:hypothetical protein